jgi:hypothetical protein
MVWRRRVSLRLQTDFIEREITYDGYQLDPHWIYRQHGIQGDAAVAFIGPCSVSLSEMVDIEDVRKDAPIYSPLMLHVIAEFFDDLGLHATVYRQRLLIVAAKELLEELTGRRVRRDGDDLYLDRAASGEGKLSVSIATSSVSSMLIHTGFNILTEGTPVPTVGLRELAVDPAAFGRELLARYAAELEDIYMARCKVRPVLGNEKKG